MAARTAGRVGACYEMPMCELGVTNTKMGQDHISVSGLLGGETPSFNGGINQDGNERLTLGEEEVRMIWKDYFEDQYNIDTKKLVAVNMCGFDGIQRGSCFGGELI